MMTYQPLTRSKTSRIIAGVCGGLGEYFKIDPTLIRILFCILLFAGGAGAALYLLLWVIIPASNSSRAKRAQDSASEEIRQHIEQVVQVGKNAFHPSRKSLVITASCFIFLGAVILVDRYMPQFSLIDFWPVIFILIGLLMLYTAFPFRTAETPQQNEPESAEQIHDN